MNTQPIVECSWCNEEFGRKPTPGASHTVCERHRAIMLLDEGAGAPLEVAITYRDLERAAKLDNERVDKIMADFHGRTGWGVARDMAIGALLGAMAIGTLILALLAL